MNEDVYARVRLDRLDGDLTCLRKDHENNKTGIGFTILIFMIMALLLGKALNERLDRIECKCANNAHVEKAQ